MRVNFQETFVLHSRSYRDTSLLLDLFTKEHGILRALAHGVRKAKSKVNGLLLPFIPLAVSLSGKTELLSVNKVEARGLAYKLPGKAVFCGFYLNELLIKLLHTHDSYPKLFDGYADTLDKLQNPDKFIQQLALRLFEKLLLKEIGYALQLDKDADGNVIEKQFKYYYKFGIGLVRADFVTCDIRQVISGQCILALRFEQLSTLEEYREAKLLLRRVINSLLSSPLKIRELW